MHPPQTPKVELVPADSSYAEQWMRWRQETNTLRFNPLASVTVAQLRDRLGSACSSLSDLGAAREFCFFVKLADGRIAGSVTLNGVSLMMMYGEIGYTIGEEFQGKGVGTAAVRAFAARIFAETPIRRILAHVAEGNVASRKLLERLGFVNEGTLREHYLIQGVPTNEVIYGLLRGELKD